MIVNEFCVYTETVSGIHCIGTNTTALFGHLIYNACNIATYKVIIIPSKKLNLSRFGVTDNRTLSNNLSNLLFNCLFSTLHASSQT